MNEHITPYAAEVIRQLKADIAKMEDANIKLCDNVMAHKQEIARLKAIIEESQQEISRLSKSTGKCNCSWQNFEDCRICSKRDKEV